MKRSKPIVEIYSIIITVFFLVSSCTSNNELSYIPEDTPYIIVLGTSQDGGYPQAGCTKECCRKAWDNPKLKRLVTCLAIVDPMENRQWLIDATPDFKEQFYKLGTITGNDGSKSLSGVILTHAHAGHYTGLIHLGREIMGTTETPVYAMPRMEKFLRENGPWDQLVRLKNIQITTMKNDSTIHLNQRIAVTPMLVPHRDEYTETAGLLIETDDRKALFIPDIDKWDDWETDICDLVKEVDIAFLDATFYDINELPGREMSDIPHPFIVESFEKFNILSDKDRAKIHFIHFNHTNTVIQVGSDASDEVQQRGYSIAQECQIVKL